MSNKKRSTFGDVLSPHSKYGWRGLQSSIILLFFPQIILSQTVSLQVFQNAGVQFRIKPLGIYFSGSSKDQENRSGTINWSRNLQRYGLLFQGPSKKFVLGFKLGVSKINLDVDQSYRCRLFATQGDPKECKNKKGEWLNQSYNFYQDSNQISLYLGSTALNFMSFGIQWNLFSVRKSNKDEISKLDSRFSMLEKELQENFVEYYLKFYGKL